MKETNKHGKVKTKNNARAFVALVKKQRSLTLGGSVSMVGRLTPVMTVGLMGDVCS